jgi:hypothetical protein
MIYLYSTGALMKIKSLALAFTTLALTLVTTATFQKSGQAIPPTVSQYVCRPDLSGVPTTYAVVNGGLSIVPIIRWSRGSLGGVPPEQRCSEVTRNFNRLHIGKGNYVLKARSTPNGRIICLTQPGQVCTRSGDEPTLLFTLRPEDGAQWTINRLNKVGEAFSAGPLNETSGNRDEVSVDLNEYISQQVAQRQ